MKIYKYKLTGEFIKEYPSIIEASKSLGVTSSNITVVAKGGLKTAYGYQWSYDKKDLLEPVKSRRYRTGESNSKKVLQTDKNTGKIIKEFKSISDAGKSLGKKHTLISMNCTGRNKTAYGYIWKYKDNK